MTFRPYFDAADFPFIAGRSTDWFGAGHISRQDEDKFSKDTLHIYEHFASPVRKRGTFLGFDRRSEAKTGRPPDWVETFHDQKSLSQQEFYRRCHIVLQPTDTTENWPRVGFEAMASGSVLVVDRRGGWEQMVEHGKTGWLCECPGDFITSPTTGKTWPLPPVSGAWPWAGRKLPWKAGGRCLRQSAGYLIPNCRFCSDRNANRFFPADQMSHVPYWRRFFCLSML